MQRRPSPSRERFQAAVERLKSGQSTVPGGVDAETKRRRHRTVWQLIGGFLKLIRSQWPGVAFALATVTVSTVLGLIPPAVTKLIVDHVVGTEPWPAEWPLGGASQPSRKTLLLILLVGTLTIAIVRNLIHLWGRWVATRANKRVQRDIRRRAFDHAVRLPLHRVHELKSGGVASLLREDAGTVGDLIFGLLYNPWRAVVQLLGTLAILAWVDWQLLIGGLALLPLVYFTHRTWISQIRPQFRAVRNTRQELDAQTTETFGGMRVVRAFGRQASEAGRFIRGNNLLTRQELRVWWAMRLVEVLWGLLIPVGTAALLWYGGGQVLEGRLTLGDLMMFLVYLLMLLEPLAVLAESAATLQNNLAALDRVFDLLAEPKEFADLPGAKLVRRDDVRGEIQLQGVSFAYPGNERRVLDDVSLHVPAGCTVALVGPSGAGKTTLCNLVARFYDPLAGRVLLDGVDIREYKVESYRRLLGIVEQDVFLFDGTVAQNIAFGRPTASDADIDAAAKVAHAAEFIAELPNGYDTIIGERGVKLSGGQRQRLAIARAVLADPKILILDEATSNLDSESEQLIQQGLSQLMTGRTCFVIAHRLSTIRHADQIVVVKEGRILETGTHDELIQYDGRYRWMVELQVGGPALVEG
jgi:ATP-binding cassette subfamily B protein/subfamily B ATP-binding cassette protein MsbA